MTLPEGAELGTTTDPKALIKGEPSQVQANGSRLSDESTRVVGLADDVDDVTVDGWEGGFGQPAYVSARKAEQDKWRTYADLLKKAGSALSTYAGALSTAQGKAADAIAKWQQGEDLTKAAVQTYNTAVDAYNAYVNRPVPVPSIGGGPVPPSVGPGRPGPFVDPGESLRQEAQQILDDARKALEDAGATAVKELGGLEGAKTESSSGPSADGKVEGPSIDWQGFEKAFGVDPGDSGAESDRTGRSDSPFKINLVEVEGNAKAWGAEGSWEDYWGDVKVKADGSVTVLGVEGGASAHIGSDGVVIGANGKAVLVGAEGSVGGEWGIAEAEAKGEAYVGANAEGEVRLGPTGAHANGELFAGAKAEGTVSGDIAGIGGEATAEGWAGIGIGGDVDFGYDDGKFTVGGSGGVALGLGGKLGGEITIDPGQVLDTGGDILDGIGELFEMTTTLPVPVTFELPNEHWEPVLPGSLGVENAAFLAVRRGLHGDYAPTITISGDWRNDDATLEQIADESILNLRAQGATEVELVKRSVVESEHAPAVIQSIGAIAQAEGKTFDLRQAQTVMGLVDVKDPSRRVVLIYTLTCTYGQFHEIGPEFQDFMASVEVAGVALQP